jgi:hypothetical protein
MSNQSIPLTELEQSSAAAFKQMGDRHAGRVIATRQQQQTDPKTGQPKFFSSGGPMMLWIITIEKADGESAALWAKGGSKFKVASGTGESMLAAIGTAVKAAGATSLDIGGELAVAWTGEAEPEPGMNPAKLYTAQYRPPARASVPVDDLFAP